MRRLAVLLAAAISMTVPGVVLTAGTAVAQCEFDGTIPGTPARTYAVSVVGQTIYVDDRDYIDLDDDGIAGGIWLYYESNHLAGLQRGGDQVVLGKIPGNAPYIPPTQVIPPDPNRPVFPYGYTLFPAGFGGQSWARTVGEHDPCTDSPQPDTVLL